MKMKNCLREELFTCSKVETTGTNLVLGIDIEIKVKLTLTIHVVVPECVNVTQTLQRGFVADH